MEIKVLSKNSKIVEGKIVVTKEMEEHLTYQDLIYSKDNIKRQKAQLAEQTRRFKEQYDELTAKEAEIDEMMALLGSSANDEPFAELE